MIRIGFSHNKQKMFNMYSTPNQENKIINFPNPRIVSMTRSYGYDTRRKSIAVTSLSLGVSTKSTMSPLTRTQIQGTFDVSYVHSVTDIASRWRFQLRISKSLGAVQLQLWTRGSSPCLDCEFGRPPLCALLRTNTASSLCELATSACVHVQSEASVSFFCS